jgi:hypothetical protein
MKLAYEKLQNDYEKLRKEEADRSSKLQELVYLQKKLFEKRFVFNKFFFKKISTRNERTSQTRS